MSKQEENGGGCGCFLVVAMLVGAFLLNPTEKQHRAAIGTKTPVIAVSVGMTEVMGAMKLKYHNYIFFSFTTLDAGNKTGLPVSYGFFGKVFYGKDK